VQSAFYNIHERQYFKSGTAHAHLTLTDKMAPHVWNMLF
jgi:hypothetical protein